MSRYRAAAPPDSVPVVAPTGDEDESKNNSSPRIRVENIKLVFALFLIFMAVVSDMFVNNVLTGFGEGAVSGREPTAWGSVLQGVLLCIFYIVAIYLIEHEIL